MWPRQPRFDSWCGHCSLGGRPRERRAYELPLRPSTRKRSFIPTKVYPFASKDPGSECKTRGRELTSPTWGGGQLGGHPREKPDRRCWCWGAAVGRRRWSWRRWCWCVRALQDVSEAVPRAETLCARAADAGLTPKAQPAASPPPLLLLPGTQPLPQSGPPRRLLGSALVCVCVCVCVRVCVCV